MKARTRHGRAQRLLRERAGHAWRRGWWWLWLVLSTHVITPLISRAQDEQPSTFSLTWTREQGAESCISSELLELKVQALTGSQLRPAKEADLMIKGHVRRDATARSWQVQIVVESARGQSLGERQILSEKADCSALTPSILLVLSMVMELEAEHSIEPLTSPTHGVEPIASTPVLGGSAPPPEDSGPALGTELKREKARRAYLFEPVAAVALSRGIQPSLSPGARLGVRWISAGPLSVLLSGTYWLPRSVVLQSEYAKGQVEFRAMQAELMGCIRVFVIGDWLWQSCAGAVLGTRSSLASTLAERNKVRRSYGGAMVALESRYALTMRWYLTQGLHAAALGPPARFTYQEADGQERLLFRPAQLATWAALSASAHF